MSFDYIQKTIEYSQGEVFHCIPHVHSKVALKQNLFSTEDKSIIEKVVKTNAFVVSDKDYKRFEFNQQKLVTWQIKIITQLLVHFKSSLKILAYNEEVERLSYLAAILTTCGFADQVGFHCQEIVNIKNQNTMKLTLTIQRSKKFESQYLIPEVYGQQKNKLMQNNVEFNETIFFKDKWVFKNNSAASKWNNKSDLKMQKQISESNPEQDSE